MDELEYGAVSAVGRGVIRRPVALQQPHGPSTSHATGRVVQHRVSPSRAWAHPFAGDQPDAPSSCAPAARAAHEADNQQWAEALKRRNMYHGGLEGAAGAAQAVFGQLHLHGPWPLSPAAVAAAIAARWQAAPAAFGAVPSSQASPPAAATPGAPMLHQPPSLAAVAAATMASTAAAAAAAPAALLPPAAPLVLAATAAAPLALLPQPSSAAADGCELSSAAVATTFMAAALLPAAPAAAAAQVPGGLQAPPPAAAAAAGPAGLGLDEVMLLVAQTLPAEVRVQAMLLLQELATAQYGVGYSPALSSIPLSSVMTPSSVGRWVRAKDAGVLSGGSGTIAEAWSSLRALLKVLKLPAVLVALGSDATRRMRLSVCLSHTYCLITLAGIRAEAAAAAAAAAAVPDTAEAGTGDAGAGAALQSTAQHNTSEGLARLQDGKITHSPAAGFGSASGQWQSLQAAPAEDVPASSAAATAAAAAASSTAVSHHTKIGPPAVQFPGYDAAAIIRLREPKASGANLPVHAPAINVLALGAATQLAATVAGSSHLAPRSGHAQQQQQQGRSPKTAQRKAAKVGTAAAEAGFRSTFDVFSQRAPLDCDGLDTLLLRVSEALGATAAPESEAADTQQKHQQWHQLVFAGVGQLQLKVKEVTLRGTVGEEVRFSVRQLRSGAAPQTVLKVSVTVEGKQQLSTVSRLSKLWVMVLLWQHATARPKTAVWAQLGRWIGAADDRS